MINRLQKGNIEIASIGPKYDYTYPVTNLGSNLNILYNIIQGKHDFCKKLKKAKNPVIIIGSNFFNENGEAKFIIEKLKNLSFLNYLSFNVVQKQSSYINFLEIFNKKNNYENNLSNLYYLFNTNINKNLNDKIFNSNNFIIYQGHHFTLDAQKANIIIPGLTFLEKEGIYINIEGFIQKNNSALKIKGLQKSDINIFKYLYIFLIKTNQLNNKKKLYLNFENLYSYLFKNKLNKIFIFKKSRIKLKQIKKYNLHSIKKIYIDTILENYSKILIESKNILKKNTNFF